MIKIQRGFDIPREHLLLYFVQEKFQLYSKRICF